MSEGKSGWYAENRDLIRDILTALATILTAIAATMGTASYNKSASAVDQGRENETRIINVQKEAEAAKVEAAETKKEIRKLTGLRPQPRVDGEDK